MPPPHAPRTVYTLRACTQPRSRHERASQDWVARRLASLCGWAYGGAYETRSAPAWHPYFVPDETLDLEQATRLGIQGEDDLFGGVVPHAFVASKVITHGVPDAASPVPRGWSHALANRLDGAVLPGFTAFDATAIATAGQQLLAHGGRVRVKEAQARGGHGQHLAADAGSLRRIAAKLDPEALHRHGVVIEQHLDEATTCSVGEIRVAGRRLAYLGIQHEVTDRHGRAVYGGSSLRVLEGGMDTLGALARNDGERAAIAMARRYDAAVQAAYPGFFASRRNYDVVAGLDARGQQRCGVLEQSWRVGGASPAELVALAAFLQPHRPAAVEATCRESHDPAHAPPPGADTLFHDPEAAHGPVIKYARVEGIDGHPA